ncbi:TetR/AcrR family transcriptional regulator [Agromyces sp. H66]|uniref:TetR/AcrR family transcriptional regulator n=1 Tax=Agromyces sp. H66 TaxID=2529859 RepID=UPI00145ADF41|nr:TetR/AcrR family transcriptional regulator [Agromyces sp. H66]
MRPGPRRSVSQADIVDAAFEILEQKGFAAASVRGVAASLGLTPTALYTYFPSKNALLRAMVEQLLSTVAVDTERRADATWRDQVHAHAAALRARLAEHVGAIVLVTSGPLDGPHALGLNEALVAGFVADGMPHADAARAAHAVRAYVLGVAALDAAERAGDPAGAPPAATGDTLWSDAAAYPLTEATTSLAGDGFGWGLDRLLDGFERLAA